MRQYSSIGSPLVKAIQELSFQCSLEEFESGMTAPGNPRHETVSAAHLGGSFETAIQIRCDGSFVSLSGNIGRFCRRDNLFNLSFRATIEKANRILMGQGLPPFTARRVSKNDCEENGAKISRLDITSNLVAGNEQQARAVIRWLAAQSVSRMRKGIAGDESVW